MKNCKRTGKEKTFSSAPTRQCGAGNTNRTRRTFGSKRGYVCLTVCLAALLLLFAACGGGTEETTQSPTPPPSAPDTSGAIGGDAPPTTGTTVDPLPEPPVARYNFPALTGYQRNDLENGIAYVGSDEEHDQIAIFVDAYPASDALLADVRNGTLSEASISEFNQTMSLFKGDNVKSVSVAGKTGVETSAVEPPGEGDTDALVERFLLIPNETSVIMVLLTGLQTYESTLETAYEELIAGITAKE